MLWLSDALCDSKCLLIHSGIQVECFVTIQRSG